jgi:hypothetical protein
METLESYIMPIIIGNFLYVSLTIMIVKLKDNKGSTYVLETVGFIFGVWTIYSVS